MELDGKKYHVGDIVEVMNIKPGTIDTPYTRSFIGKNLKIIKSYPGLSAPYRLEDEPHYLWYNSELLPAAM